MLMHTRLPNLHIDSDGSSVTGYATVVPLITSNTVHFMLEAGMDLAARYGASAPMPPPLPRGCLAGSRWSGDEGHGSVVGDVRDGHRLRQRRHEAVDGFEEEGGVLV